MSEQTHGAAGSPIDDDTLVRPMGAFYNGQPPAPETTSAPVNSAPGSSAPASSAPANQAPTLAERLMRRLPAPPEKAQARQQYEQRQRQAEAHRMQELEELRRADAERAAAREPSPAFGEAPARPAGHAAAATAVRAAVPVGAAAGPASTLTPTVAGTGHLEPATTASGPGVAVASRAARRTRKARLRIARIDPWSVMKTFFLFAIAGGIAFVTFVALMYTLIDGSGLFDQVDEMVNLVFGTQDDNTPFDIRSVAGMERVLGISALLACINVVILTALATLGSFLYNLSATMLGGLELTLAED